MSCYLLYNSSRVNTTMESNKIEVKKNEKRKNQSPSNSGNTDNGITKPQHRHSISYINSTNGNSVPRLGERRSSFASPSSSYARRRSFLSPSMISNEKHTVYELHSGIGYNTPSFSISLKESQGFSWNQDLFASQYQQQSNAFYDDDEDDDDDAVVDDDDDNAELDNRNNMGHRYSRSLSMSNENGYKVRVIDIKVDEDENIFQVDA